MKKRLGIIQYITYNIYWLGLNMATGSLTPIILPYLVAQFVGDAVKGTALGTLRSAGLIIAIIVQPTAGADGVPSSLSARCLISSSWPLSAWLPAIGGCSRPCFSCSSPPI